MSQVAEKIEKHQPKSALIKDAAFKWDDPLDLEGELSEEERMVRDTARDYAQEKLFPRVIAANLASALRTRLRGHSSGCRVEVGSGAAPRRQKRDTARIPDITVRCGEHPKVVFEVVSPSELRKWRQRDEKRADLQNVEGVWEIIEIYQSEAAVHVYRLAADGSWHFEANDGVTAVVRLDSVGLEIPLAEIYEDLDLAEGVTEQ